MMEFGISPGDAINEFSNILTNILSKESRRLNPNDFLIGELKISFNVHFHELKGHEKGNGYIKGFEIGGLNEW